MDVEKYPELAIDDAVKALVHRADRADRDAALWRRALLRLAGELNEPGRDPLNTVQICQRLANEARKSIEGS